MPRFPPKPRIHTLPRRIAEGPIVEVLFEDTVSDIAWAHETGVTYSLAFDPHGGVATKYGLFGLPTTFFVAADGRVRGREIGELHPTSLRFGLDRVLAVISRSSSR